MKDRNRIRKIACVGSGLIGHSWATLFITKGFNVCLCDKKEELLAKALKRIKLNISFLAERGLIEEEAVKSRLKEVETTTNVTEAVSDVDYVQESVSESYKVKKPVFKEMDAATSEDVILASSSSGLLITEIQKATRKPERCIIAHPLNPPHLIPLVELVPGESTSPETIQRTYNFMRKIGKIPVILKKEVQGYVVNRLAAALWREAINLVDKEIVSVEDIDKVMWAGLGIRWALMGPFLTYHLGGGQGGIKYFIEHIGPSFSSCWKTMETWTSIPQEAARKVIEGVNQLEIVQTKSVKEITRWRDSKLAKLLELLFMSQKLQSSDSRSIEDSHSP